MKVWRRFRQWLDLGRHRYNRMKHESQAHERASRETLARAREARERARRLLVLETESYRQRQEDKA